MSADIQVQQNGSMSAADDLKNRVRTSPYVVTFTFTYVIGFGPPDAQKWNSRTNLEGDVRIDG